jgi:hypothetical protein
MVPKICIFLLQDLSYRKLDLGMSFRQKKIKKGAIPKTFLRQLWTPVLEWKITK